MVDFTSPADLGQTRLVNSRRPTRKLNTGFIKQVVVFAISLPASTLCGVAGQAAQPGMAPFLKWLLGFEQPKASATAARFTLLSAAAALTGASISHAARPSTGFLGLSLFGGAILGAILGTWPMRFTAGTAAQGWLRSFGVAFSLFVLAVTAHVSPLHPPPNLHWSSASQVALIGVCVGAIGQASRLPTGLFMPPALYYAGGFQPAQAIELSLMVVALGSVLPVLSYARARILDTQFAGVMAVAAVAGGLVAGRLLAYALDPIGGRWTILAGAAFSTFLCARELAVRA